MLSAAHVAVWVARSYRHEVTPWTRIAELCFCAFYAIYYCFSLIRSNFDPWFPLSKIALVDVFTIISPLYYASTPAHSIPWISLSFLRAEQCAAAYSGLEDIALLEQLSEVTRSVIALTLSSTSLVVVLSCTVLVLEVLGDPEIFQIQTTITDMGEISFEQMFYWMFTTISTVGYGDFAPTNLLSRFVIIYSIVKGVIMFSIQTGKLIDLKELEGAGKGRFQPNRRHGFVVVVGGAVSKYSWVLPNFLNELYQLENADRMGFPAAVLMAPRDIDYRLRDFLKSMPSHARERIRYLNGNAMSENDMDRACLNEAKLVVVLPDVRAESKDDQDEENILIALAMKRTHSRINLRLMVLRPESKVRAVSVGLQDSRCFSINELKSSLLSLSCCCRGWSTLISNLIHADVGDEDEYEYRDVAGPTWVNEYRRGNTMDFHGMAIANRFIGFSWKEFVRDCIDVGVVPLGVQIDGRIVLNPKGYIMQRGDCVFSVHPGEDHLDRIDIVNHFVDWRQEFVKRQLDGLRSKSRRSPERPGPPTEVPKVKVRIGSTVSGTLSGTLSGPLSGRSARSADSSLEQPLGRRTNANLVSFREGSDDQHSVLPQFALWARKNDSCQRKKTITGEGGQSTGNSAVVAGCEEDELEELAELAETMVDKGGHILVLLLAHGMWQQVQSFVQCLRAEHLPHFLPILILTEQLPSREVCQETAWLFQEVSFLHGSHKKVADLERAGFRTAHTIMIITDSVASKKEWSMVDCTGLMALMNIENEGVAVHTVLELINEASAKLLTRLPLVDDTSEEEEDLFAGLPGMKGHPPLPKLNGLRSGVFVPGDRMDSVASAWEHKQGPRSPSMMSRICKRFAPTVKEPRDKAEAFNLLPRYASGSIFTASCLGALAARAYYTPGIIELLEALLLGPKRAQETFPFQIHLPQSCVGKPYFSIVDMLLNGWPTRPEGDAASGEEKNDPAIPLGLYRISSAAEKTVCRYVVSNPPRSIVLQATDLVFVLGSADFGRACFEAGALQLDDGSSSVAEFRGN